MIRTTHNALFRRFLLPLVSVCVPMLFGLEHGKTSK